MSDPTDIERFKALFLLAGIPVNGLHELPNNYWPEAYADLRKAHPWALMLTPHGAIKIGWRKRVLSISWTDTPLRKVITEDETTKDPDMVHAWSYIKALEYLIALRQAFAAAALAPTLPLIAAIGDAE